MDSFKTAISAPGAALKMLFDECDAPILLVSEICLYSKPLNGILSVVRVLSSNDTARLEIVSVEKKTRCENVVGYDANSLYLYCH